LIGNQRVLRVDAIMKDVISSSTVNMWSFAAILQPLVRTEIYLLIDNMVSKITFWFIKVIRLSTVQWDCTVLSGGKCLK
jgi:hypothetical protein